MIRGVVAPRGPVDRDMVCGGCGRAFKAVESSWAAAERKPCPRCGSKDTTPILEKKV